jgi:hypothetical protein
MPSFWAELCRSCHRGQLPEAVGASALRNASLPPLGIDALSQFWISDPSDPEVNSVRLPFSVTKVKISTEI